MFLLISVAAMVMIELVVVFVLLLLIKKVKNVVMGRMKQSRRKE